MNNKKMFTLLAVLVLCGAVILLLLAFVQSYERTEEKINVKVTDSASFSKKITSVQFGNVVVPVFSASTDAEQRQGLSERTLLPADQGMLFVFSKPDLYGFWMKDMKFPIDIIWINENSDITYIARDVKPESFPKIFKPTEKALYVLEVNSGFAANHAIQVGDHATFSTN
jgi:uncharacterized membrane protein (UPF0127 family)